MCCQLSSTAHGLLVILMLLIKYATYRKKLFIRLWRKKFNVGNFAKWRQHRYTCNAGFTQCWCCWLRAMLGWFWMWLQRWKTLSRSRKSCWLLWDASGKILVLSAATRAPMSIRLTIPQNSMQFVITVQLILLCYTAISGSVVWFYMISNH